MEKNLVKVLEIIKEEYGIETQNCAKLNIGFDINTLLFKILSKDNKEYFLKIRINGFSELSLIVPLLISEIKPSHIINAVKTIQGKLYVHYSSLFIMVFPFINGQSGWNVSLTKSQFIEFGNVLHELHSIKLPHKYKNSIRKETFDNKYRERITYYLNNIQCNYRDIIINEFMASLQNRKNIIIKMLDYLEETLKGILLENYNFCLCHGDIHAGNILINQDNFYIVDWDTIILAPKERDLMFIGGGIGNKWNKIEEIEYFYNGYGNEIEVNKKLLKYYRFERIIQDIYEFYIQITEKKGEKEDQELCIEYFNEQFEENNVVDIAFST